MSYSSNFPGPYNNNIACTIQEACCVASKKLSSKIIHMSNEISLLSTDAQHEQCITKMPETLKRLERQGDQDSASNGSSRQVLCKNDGN